MTEINALTRVEKPLPETAQDAVTYADGALAEMQKQINFHLANLNTRQKQFVRFFAEGHPLAEAAKLAGYRGRNVRNNANALLRENTHVQSLLCLMREVDGIKYGFPADWKRAELHSLYRQARDKEQLSVANQVMKTILELDGDIKQPAVQDINVNLNHGPQDINPDDLAAVARLHRVIVDAEFTEVKDDD